MHYKLLKVPIVLIAILVFTANADITDNVTVNLSTKYQIFEGFGEGTMDQFVPYWYTIYPTANLDSFLDQLYTLEDNGLGFTICRVLMPVGDAPGHAHHTRMWLIGNRAPESFEPEENTFVWTGHEDILWRHQGAAQRGAVMWANWYSMPYWLTISGCTSGASDGLQNLISGKEGRFAQHACDVIEHYRDYWGIDFDYVSLLNEPEPDWWVEGGGQPGCHFSSSQAITVTSELKNHLDSYDLSTKILAYDAAWTNQWSYLDDMLTSVVQPYLSVISCHQYSVSAAGMDAWRQRAISYNKSLWQTEWGDWANAGYPNNYPHAQAVNHANKISQALNDLSATGWGLWGPDFIFDVGAGGFHPREAFWATAQYSRHIRPGMQRINSTESNSDCKTTVWLDPNENQPKQNFVLVTFNSNTSQTANITYDFSALPPVLIKEIRQTSSSKDYESISFAQTSSDSFSISVPAESITTIVAEILHCDGIKEADFNEDCIVDFYDLAEQMGQWLSDLPCEQLNTDLNGDCDVNFLDYAQVVDDDWKNIKAFKPKPENGQSNVYKEVTLNWMANFNASSHDVYIGTNQTVVENATRGSPQDKGNHTTNSYPINLDISTDYFWRIDPVDNNGSIGKGDVWTFKTGSMSLDPNLAGWWKLDEDSGPEAADSSLEGNNGTLQGDPNWMPSGGYIDGAIDLDGNGDAVTVSGFSITTDTITITAWINGHRTADWAGLVYSRSAVACGIHHGGDSRLHYTWNDNSSSTWNWSGGPLIPDDEWAFVAAVIEPTKATLYVYTTAGGLSQGTNNITHYSQLVDDIKFGYDDIGDTRRFDGLMDDIRIYNRPLSQQEILDIINE